MKKLPLIIIILIILVLVTSAYFYTQKNKSKQNQEREDVSNIPGVLPDFGSVSNPVGDKLPEINPIEKTNPFKNVYKNPFE